MRTRLACAALAMIAGAACTDTDSATSLHPEGPPMILQVLLKEHYVDSQMNVRQRELAFAFGTHELAPPEDVHRVQTAQAVDNEFRIIIDELLVGNSLEEIQCRGTVDEDSSGDYGRVPPGADPDDVARCAVGNDVLPATCRGSDPQSVCICQRANGCLRDGQLVEPGKPVGVMDINQDGAADDTRFVAGAVGIQCGSIAVPISIIDSYWSPSGNQIPPASGGFKALGPKIYLKPSGVLPTNVTCGLVFAPEVVDKQGIRVCAPAGGDPAAGCSPGDVSAFTFGVEPLSIATASPPEGAVGISRTPTLSYNLDAPIDPATLAGISITPAPPQAPLITTPLGGLTIDFKGLTPLAPQTLYTVTFPTTITDTFAQPLPQAKSFHFTTGN